MNDTCAIVNSMVPKVFQKIGNTDYYCIPFGASGAFGQVAFLQVESDDNIYIIKTQKTLDDSIYE